MRFYITLVISLLIAYSAFSQTFRYNYSIGKFKNASAFTITAAGIIYVSDAASDEVYKLDTLGNYLRDVGGYGWDEGAFDQPVDVFANPLSVYVSDKNNNRIQKFDKDLNFISLLYTRESDNPAERFGYPLSAVTSNQGDLFILDSENKRILKFDLFGHFIMNFGGFDSGNYALVNPEKMVVSPSNSLFVLDGKKIVVFDQYGNGVTELQTGSELKSINLVFNNLLLNTDKKILMSNLKSGIFKFSELKTEDEETVSGIVSSLVFNGKLYVLKPAEIRIYSLVKS
jgi:DNA-binding beta-propeller fold protein YncE